MIYKLYEKHLTPGRYHVPKFVPTKKTGSILNSDQKKMLRRSTMGRSWIMMSRYPQYMTHMNRWCLSMGRERKNIKLPKKLTKEKLYKKGLNLNTSKTIKTLKNNLKEKKI